MPDIIGVSIDDVLIDGGAAPGAGQRFRIDSAYSASTDGLTFSFTDGDGILDASGDGDQTASVHDAAGTLIADGPAAAQQVGSVTAPDGSTIRFYAVSINEVVVGYVADAPFQPGVTYQLDSYDAIDGTNAPAYADLQSQTYEQSADNTILGGDYGDRISAGDGADSVDGGAGNDLYYGGDGNDTLYRGAGSDTVFGGGGSDLIDDRDGVELGGDDTLFGEAGNDTIFGGSGNDLILGGANNDLVDGGAGNDRIRGGTGSDTLDGDAGNDQVDGEAGDDLLDGGDGEDTLDGGPGNDTLTGGAGKDVFAFSDGDGANEITDFDLVDADGDGRSDDQLDVRGLTDAGGAPVDLDDVTVTDDGLGNAILTFPDGTSIRMVGVTPAQMSRTQMYQAGVPCFAHGTQIATAGGPRPVEALRPGMRVATASGRLARVLWVGERRLEADDLARRPDLRPVRIAAGTLRAARDLVLSPQHCLAVRAPGWDGPRLVRARQLARLEGGGARVMRGCRAVRYAHVLLDRHDLMQAEGAWCESFWPGPAAVLALSAEGRRSLQVALAAAAPYARRVLPLARSRELPGTLAGLRVLQAGEALCAA